MKAIRLTLGWCLYAVAMVLAVPISLLWDLAEAIAGQRLMLPRPGEVE